MFPETHILFSGRTELLGCWRDVAWMYVCFKYVRHCLSRGQIPELMLMSREGLYSNLPKNTLTMPSYIQRGLCSTDCCLLNCFLIMVLREQTMHIFVDPIQYCFVKNQPIHFRFDSPHHRATASTGFVNFVESESHLMMDQRQRSFMLLLCLASSVAMHSMQERRRRSLTSCNKCLMRPHVWPVTHGSLTAAWRHSCTMNSIGWTCQRESPISWASWCTAVFTVWHLGTSLIISLLPLTSLRGFVCVPQTDISLLYLAVGPSGVFNCRFDGLEFVAARAERFSVRFWQF